MTVGQRIAQKRRELGLSQEALGERLGVSRQAIYKWESDAALPEIEKLVNLSREFGVTVGWLLGEEDGRPELTPEQIRVVEEIVGRYLDARPPEHTVILRETAEPEDGEGADAQTSRRRRWPWVLAGVAAVLVVATAASSLFSRLDEMNRAYQNLQGSIANITSDVNRQIYSITQRVEEVLQGQNALTAEQSAQVAETDCRANTVTIEARAVPRTFVAGMTAEFTVVSGGESFTAAGELGENHAFTASVTVPLTDDITVSAAFLHRDQRQTQVLREFTNLYSDSFAQVSVYGGGSSATKSGDAAAWTVTMRPVDVSCVDSYGNPAKLTSLRVGLFRDQKLVEWLTEVEQSGFLGDHQFRLEQERIQMDVGHTYCIAAVVEDEYGREWVVPSQHGSYAATENSGLGVPTLERLSRDPADWEY